MSWTEARRTHPFLLEGGQHRSSPSARDLDDVGASFEDPLPEPPAGTTAYVFDAGRARVVRRLVRDIGVRAGLGATRIDRSRPRCRRGRDQQHPSRRRRAAPADVARRSHRRSVTSEIPAELDDPMVGRRRPPPDADRRPGPVAGQPTVRARPDPVVDGRHDRSSARRTGLTRRIMPLPAAFATTRDALHTLACYVVSPARKARTGRIGLRPTGEGFGTPPFDDGSRIVVHGNRLGVDPGERDRHHDAACGGSVPRRRVDSRPWRRRGPSSVRTRCDARTWTSMRRSLSDSGTAWDSRSSTSFRSVSANAPRTMSEAQLWPEHFDLAVDVELAGGRHVNVGFSPGDRFSDEPYVYVGPQDIDRSRRRVLERRCSVPICRTRRWTTAIRPRVRSRSSTKGFALL